MAVFQMYFPTKGVLPAAGRMYTGQLDLGYVRNPPLIYTSIRVLINRSSFTMASTALSSQPVVNGTFIPPPSPARKKQPYPFYLGGVAATIAASITHPLDLTKVRLQASGDKRMIQSMKKTVRTAGFRGLYDGITGTWMRQMSYSLCRFWAYDESKKLLGANPQSPPWVLAAAGVMGTLYATTYLFGISSPVLAAGSIAGVVGNPGGMCPHTLFHQPSISS